MAETAALTDAAEILERYGDMVFRTAYAMTKNRQDAEDAAQEVFVALIERAPVFANAEHQKAWLLRAVINRCKSLFRSVWHSRTDALAEDFPAVALTPDESGVAAAVNALPLKYRRAVYLYYVEGYSAKEAAVLLEVPVNTVLTQLARARARLKETLKGEFDDGSERL
ncbi:MAG: sigma-70 family RNA polymerase sigma factor [Ruthenibacterium sp.]